MDPHFSFSFAGEDIEASPDSLESNTKTPSARATTNSAFPVPGKPLLRAARHDLDAILSRLPSKISYSVLDIDLEGNGMIKIPRRELWDVRVQLMAEEEGDDSAEPEPGLGKHDVKTGIYEGGFKSWESSIDLVKVLASHDIRNLLEQGPCSLIELGCGTALPAMALFHWSLLAKRSGKRSGKTWPFMLTLADYNPTVLHLVTLPNLILAWALWAQDSSTVLQEALATEGDLELSPQVIEAFKASLSSNSIFLSFISGAWSPDFVDLLYQAELPCIFTGNGTSLVLGAETIYSPFALNTFSETLIYILRRERTIRPDGLSTAIVAAKKLYFGVGGSLDDFVNQMRSLGAMVETIREEATGVRRGVVRCCLPRNPPNLSSQ